MLDERHVSARCLMAWLLWSLSLVVWVISWALGLDDLGRLALMICAGAATFTIKGFFLKQRQYIKTVAAVTSTVASPTRIR